MQRRKKPPAQVPRVSIVSARKNAESKKDHVDSASNGATNARKRTIIADFTSRSCVIENSEALLPSVPALFVLFKDLST
jgi:hypothetical protein